MLRSIFEFLTAAFRNDFLGTYGHFVRHLGTYGHFTAVTRGHSWYQSVVTRKGLKPLHFEGKSVERVTGIEPAWPAWKAGALPLSYTRVSRLRPDAV